MTTYPNQHIPHDIHAGCPNCGHRLPAAILADSEKNSSYIKSVQTDHLAWMVHDCWAAEQNAAKIKETLRNLPGANRTALADRTREKLSCICGEEDAKKALEWLNKL